MTFHARSSYARLARNIFRTTQIGLTAEAVRRADWRKPLSPELASIGAGRRQFLAKAWLADALSKHASVATHGRFALQLLAVGAPADLLRATQRATLDDINHAELCFGLASAYAGESLGPAKLGPGVSPNDSADMRTMLVSSARIGCVGKTVGAMLATVAAERCRDATVTRVLRTIATDETRHAGLHWRFARWALRYTGDSSLGRALSEAIEVAMARHQLAIHDPLGSEQWLRSHGRLSAGSRADTAATAVREVVLPCSRALVEEAAPWLEGQRAAS